MAKLTVPDCQDILLSLMEKHIQRIKAVEKNEPFDWDSVKEAETAYFALAEAFDIIEAVRNTPITHTNAPGSTQ